MENDSNDSRKLKSLHDRLEILLQKQEASLKEIYALKSEVLKLKGEQQQFVTSQQPVEPIIEKSHITELSSDSELQTPATEESEAKESREFEEKLRSEVASTKQRSDLERFIGENLISKIGIVITVIGVGIGAKYAIDHQLISPLTRILLGYLVGLGLLFFSMRLKKEYENFSAVLLSGAMAIFYFITFAAYNFFGLIPQLVAFALMLMFTGFTVLAALKYNKQVIALYGMVGAYAIPFLLSNNTGQIIFLFVYIAIINAGILVLSFKKYWRLLYYAAFVMTWLIYASWFAVRYDWEIDFGVGIGFSSLFFVMFYATFLAYKVMQQEQFGIKDIILLLANSFLFYGFGYLILEQQPHYGQWLGGFTLVNAIVHFIVAGILVRKKLADKNLVSFVTGLVLVFVTMAIPVQLDGNWVTMLWVFQAALLFWIGRTKGNSLYEKLSYPLMVLACASLLHDWSESSRIYYDLPIESGAIAFFNIQFLTSLLFVGAFGFINYIHQNRNDSFVFKDRKDWNKMISIGLPLVLLLTIFFSFRIEIATYFNQLYADSATLINNEEYSYTDYNGEILSYQTIWLINFSIVYFCALLFVSIKKIKNDLLGRVGVLLGLITILTFLVQGLFELSVLRENYLYESVDSFFIASTANLWMRYLCFALVGTLFIIIWRQIQQPSFKMQLKKQFELLFHISVIWILSSELINWMEIAGVGQTYKLGISILWGIYSLGMVAFGIWKGRKYLRIGAIVLFAITLIKLFVYDIVNLDTILKTIVFVSLGILLLVISFLYNKYKGFISNEVEM